MALAGIYVRAEQLPSIPEFSFRLAKVVVATIDDLGWFKISKQIEMYAGLVPK